MMGYATIRVQFSPAAWVSFLNGAVWRKQKTLELLIYFTERFKIFIECVCYSVIIWYCGMRRIKRNRTFCCVFLYRAMLRENQHGGREYDDLQIGLL